MIKKYLEFSKESKNTRENLIKKIEDGSFWEVEHINIEDYFIDLLDHNFKITIQDIIKVNDKAGIYDVPILVGDIYSAYVIKIENGEGYKSLTNEFQDAINILSNYDEDSGVYIMSYDNIDPKNIKIEDGKTGYVKYGYINDLSKALTLIFYCNKHTIPYANYFDWVGIKYDKEVKGDVYFDMSRNDIIDHFSKNEYKDYLKYEDTPDLYIYNDFEFDAYYISDENKLKILDKIGYENFNNHDDYDTKEEAYKQLLSSDRDFKYAVENTDLYDIVNDLLNDCYNDSCVNSYLSNLESEFEDHLLEFLTYEERKEHDDKYVIKFNYEWIEDMDDKDISYYDNIPGLLYEWYQEYINEFNPSLNYDGDIDRDEFNALLKEELN